MAHIVSFRVEGLAGHSQPLEMAMDRHLNVFFGLNGCGKTSLLKILDSAMSNNASLLTRVPFTSASVSIYSIHYAKNFTRTTTKPTALQSPTVQQPSEIQIDQSRPSQFIQPERERLQWITTPTDEGASTSQWNHQYLPTSRLLIGGFEMTQSLFTTGFTTRFATAAPQLSMSEEQIDDFFAGSIKNLWITNQSIIEKTYYQAA